MADTDIKRGYMSSTLGCYCPRCRQGMLYKNKYSFFNWKGSTAMHTNCEVCNQPFELEVGFYYGTSYVSYAMSVAISVATFIAWWVLIGISVDDNRFMFWLITNAVILIALQPFLMRLSRSLWISWFVKYNPYWRSEQPDDASERLNPDQGNNW